MENSIDEFSQHMAATMTVDDRGLAAKPNGKNYESSVKLDLPNSELSEVHHAVFFFPYYLFTFILILTVNLVLNLR